MFKSILMKYIAAVSVIIVISFLILATVLTAVIGDYGQSMRREEMEHIADITSNVVMRGYSEQKDADLQTFLASNTGIAAAFDTLCGEDLDIYLCVIDNQKRVLLSSSGQGEAVSTAISDFISWEQVMPYLSTGTPYRQTERIEALGESYQLVYVIPLQGADGAYLGCVYAATSTESVEQVSSATIRTVIMACLWIMLAVLIAVYFITERHVNPLRRMSRAAHKYATGDFSERVEVIGNDEITELSAALDTMATELDNLEQKRNRFISDVAHELRSPMTSMLGFVEAVASGACPPEKQSYYLSLVAEEIKRLSRLVGDLLDVSRLEMGERKMNFVKYDICDNAATVLISLEQRINEKKLDVSFEAEEDRLFVNADADSMYRVLYNLIENAVKFSRAEGNLSISLSRHEGGVRFVIYNQGIGISKEDLPNIFDRFYKSDKSRGEDKKGVGLGLYFVKTIIVAHGGTITAESTEGEDCRFTVDLPVYQDEK